ncbi:MAG: hypothetical protein DRO14_04670 [Thermoprotei archaeon]|nr:MAG: hypothetical protein DRO14_04670 [Thermoprotei archaeon]
MSGLNTLKRIVLETLDELGDISTDELIGYLQSKGITSATAMDIRKAISQLIRDGVIIKIPDTRKKKFVLRLKHA